MAVDLIGCGFAPRGLAAQQQHEQMAFEEAAAAGLRSLDLLVSSLYPSADPAPPLGEIADQAVSRFRRVISILDRTGHARFRRGPVGGVAAALTPAPTIPSPPPPPPMPVRAAPPAPASSLQLAPQKSLTLDFTKPTTAPSAAAAASVTSTSFFSSVTAGGDGSVSKGRGQLVSSGKPPLAAGTKRKNQQQQHPCATGAHSDAAAAGGRCHCSKKRKHRARYTLRVPAVSSRSADIPGDEYSWRKYGQKPIKGSPYPRGYYRCSTDKACAARKMVERCRNDPDAFILTYTGGDHSHPAPIHRNSLAGTTRNRQQQRAEPPSAGGQSASASATAVAAEPSPGQSTSGGSPTTTSPRSPSMEEECNQEEAEGDEAGGASMMLMPKDEDVEMAGEEDDELKTFLGAYDQPAMDDDVGDSSRHATMDGNHAARVSPLLNVVEETFVVTPWATALGDATGWS